MTRRSKIFLKAGLLVFLGVSALVSWLFAQSPLIEVSAGVDKSVITVGDRVTYTLVINRAKELRIRTPGKGTNLGQFEIKDYRIHPQKEKDNVIIEQYDYVISVYDTGRFVIPPFPIAFLPTDTSTQYRFISSQPIEIYVRSVVNDENAEIRDIKPPFQVPRDFWFWAMIIGGAIFLLTLAGFLFWYFKRSKKGEPVFRKEVIRPAHEIALEALQQLLQTNWLADGQYKRFYEALSAILRRYLEQRFYVQAMEETTREILDSLNEVNVGARHRNLIQEVLELSDLVKFAKYIPDGKETQRAIQQTRDFIEQTRLVFKPVERVEKVEVGAASLSSPKPSVDGKPGE